MTYFNEIEADRDHLTELELEMLQQYHRIEFSYMPWNNAGWLKWMEIREKYLKEVDKHANAVNKKRIR